MGLDLSRMQDPIGSALRSLVPVGVWVEAVAFVRAILGEEEGEETLREYVAEALAMIDIPGVPAWLEDPIDRWLAAQIAAWVWQFEVIEPSNSPSDLLAEHPELVPPHLAQKE